MSRKRREARHEKFPCQNCTIPTIHLGPAEGRLEPSTDNDDDQDNDNRERKTYLYIKLTFELQHMACLHLYEGTWMKLDLI